MYPHPTYAVMPSREPLGVLDAYMWASEPKDAHGVRAGIKESTRWIEGYERLAEQAAELPTTRLVYVADRESDIVALMVKARELAHPPDWLIRSQHDRALPDGGKLWNKASAGQPLSGIHFTLAARQGQPARTVRHRMWAQRVALADAAGSVVSAACIGAREVETPASVKPVEWRLLTNREVSEFDMAVQLIDWYRARWEVELFFHPLKNGCQVEALQLTCMARLERALPLFIVVAWRIARLMRLGRTYPDLDPELLFESDEWRAATILNKKKPPKTPRRLNEVARLVAMLGGFLARKGDGEPGVKAILQSLRPEPLARCCSVRRQTFECSSKAMAQ